MPLARVPVAGGLIAGDPAAGCPGASVCKGPQPSSSPSMCISSVQMATSSYCRAEVPHLAGEPTLAGLPGDCQGNGKLPLHHTGARPRVRCHFHSPPLVFAHPSQEEIPETSVSTLPIPGWDGGWAIGSRHKCPSGVKYTYIPRNTASSNRK